MVTLTVTDNLGARTSDTARVDVLTPTLGPNVWSRHFGGTALLDNAIAHAVAVDGSGNAVVTGEFTGTVDFGGGRLTSAGDNDLFLVKYSSDGSHLWSKRFGGALTDRGYAVAVDSTGSVLVAGYFMGVVDFGGGPLSSSGNADIFVAKYSSAGVHVWSKRFGGTGHDFAYGLAVDGNDNLVMTGFFGWFGGPVDFGGGAMTSVGDSDVFVAKFNAAGAHLWSKRCGGTGADRAQGIAVDANGNVAITGYFSLTADFGGSPLTSAGARDIFVAEYSSAGAHLWSKRFGDTSDDIGASLAFDPSGRVVVTGDYYGSINFGGAALVSVGSGNMFLAMLSSTGGHVWSKRFGVGGNSAAGVTVDAAGNVIMTGTMVGAADFGGGPLWGNGSFDIFLAKFNNGGTHLWSKRFGDLSDDHGNGVATDPSGNVILTGDYFLSVDFGGGDLPSPGSADAFLVKFGP